MSRILSSSSRHILGQRVDYTTYERAAAKVLDMARNGQGGYVCISTVHMVMEGHDDPDFQRIVNRADLVTPDGVPLVWGLKLALESDISGEVFQIATGVEMSIDKLAKLAQQVVGRDVQMAHGAARQGDIDKNYSAITKARDVLGWEPEVSLEEGLKRTWEWFQGIPV